MKFGSEKGSVLVVGLILLAVLSCIGATVTYVASVDIQCARNHYYGERAFYAAEGGLNMAVADAKRIFIDDYGRNWNSLPYSIVKSSSADYDNADIEFEFEIIPKRDEHDDVILWGDENNDGVCEENYTHGYPVIKVVSTGYGPLGATAVVETIARMDIMFADIPAPLYGTSGIDASGAAASPRADGQYYADDSYYCPDAMGTPYDSVSVNGPAGMDATDFCAPKKVCPNSNYSNTGPEFPVAETIDSLKDQAVLINSPLDPSDDTTVKLSNPLNLGTEDNPGIFYCDRNLVLSQNNNATGWGILLVEGNLEANGGLDYHGIVLVKGTSIINGGGNDEVIGAFLGDGMVGINGNPKFYFDCQVIQKLINRYRQYRALTWARS